MQEEFSLYKLNEQYSPPLPVSGIFFDLSSLFLFCQKYLLAQQSCSSHSFQLQVSSAPQSLPLNSTFRLLLARLLYWTCKKRAGTIILNLLRLPSTILPRRIRLFYCLRRRKTFF